MQNVSEAIRFCNGERTDEPDLNTVNSVKTFHNLYMLRDKGILGEKFEIVDFEGFRNSDFIKRFKFFDREFDFTFKNNIWSIVDAKKITYTVVNELESSVTLQNFEINNNQKSSPCYSFSIAGSEDGIPSTTTISVYKSWEKNIWDLEQRIVSDISEYNNKLTQSLKIGSEVFYYEISVTGNTIYIRYR